MYMVAIAIYVRVVPGHAPEHDEAPALTLKALSGIVPIALIFLVVFGGIYGGVFTPTEGAGVGQVCALLHRHRGGLGHDLPHLPGRRSHERRAGAHAGAGAAR
jgi:TRAP-type mannitol/chloroaromatic compound transport system permease large subunit